MLIKRINIVLLLLSVVVVHTSCFWESSYKLAFIFPDGFKGPAVVRSNRPNGVPVKARNGIVTLSFPPSGVLEVQGDDPVHDWHRSVAQYASGKKISVVGESGDGPVPDDLVALRYAGAKGESSKGTEESWYVIGTSEDARKVKAELQRFDYGANK
jgi:hypothetical protein